MKKNVRQTIAVGLMLALLTVSAAAADWPQFLGEEDSQGVSSALSATAGADLRLRWEKNTGNSWVDVPGTPIVANNYVYYYSSRYLRKLDLKSGAELGCAEVYGAAVNQFFINIAYADGMIFVPCQTNNMDDGTGVSGCFLRVFDADTLEQLYVTEALATGQMQSPVMVHDGYVVTGTYGRNAVYAAFTTTDEDSSRGDEVKEMVWSVPANSRYGFSFNGAAFVGDYCYFGNDGALSVVDYRTGEAATFDLGEGYSIRSTIVYSKETERLYVTAIHPEGCASVHSFELGDSGMPMASSEREWVSHTEGGGTQSTPVIHNGRLYLGGGGHTMGSAEPFHVLDAATLEEIYSVPIQAKSSAAITTAYATEENGRQVYIYMVPYAPNAKDYSELWIIKDREGQTRAEYEVVDEVGRRQYCSQSLVIAPDGSLIWYNDAGRLYCYENTVGIFTDTVSHWGGSYIASMARRGIINGMGDGTFAPNSTMTRAQFVQMLAKMSGDEFASCTTDVFSDVATQWYAPAIAWAVEQGVSDINEGVFRPTEAITREEMALMLHHYVTNVAEAELAEKKEPVRFTDAQEIDAGAVEAVTSMQRSGIIDGMPDGSNFRFAPKEQATRAQAATMISRFYEALNEQG